MIDPNLFHIDWERTFEALAGIVVLSFFVERACALLFESRWWIRKLEDAKIDEDSGSVSRIGSGGALPDAGTREKLATADEATANTTAAEEQKVPPELLPGQRYPLKEIIGFVVALLICWVWKFDAISIVLLSQKTSLIGIFVTAGVVAGGSKASIKLFHDVLGVGSSATQKRLDAKKQAKKAEEAR